MGFYLGSWFAYFVYISSCIAQLGEISGIFHKILRKYMSLHETARESICAREPRPIMFWSIGGQTSKWCPHKQHFDFLSDKTNRFYVVLGVNINRS